MDTHDPDTGAERAQDDPALDRTRRADRWEEGADQRERLADERDAAADERDWLADERDRLLDRQERELARLERTLADQGMDATALLTAVREAVRRAESAPGRATEELVRARQAEARAEGTAARSAAAQDRAAAAKTLADTQDAEEEAWLLDRRDFVAAERDRLADARERTADSRDQVAALREDLADKRDRALEQQRKGGAGVDRHLGILKLTPRADTHRRAGREAETAQWRPAAFGPSLVAAFAELNDRLFTDTDPSAALAETLDLIVSIVPGCDGASLTMWQRASVFDTVATNPAAATLDNLQYVGGEGPAWRAMKGGGPVHVPDAPREARWPALSAAARTVGVQEMLSFGLPQADEAPGAVTGSFTLFSTTPDAFGDEERASAAVLAAYLTIAVASFMHRSTDERREASLHRALSTRDVIGQAKGILMERLDLSAADAFDVLRATSQRLNMRLADAAEVLTHTGSLPSADQHS